MVSVSTTVPVGFRESDAVHEDERQHWTEVDLSGTLRRHVMLPERIFLRAITGGKLYGVATDELGVQRVATLELH